MTRYLADAVSMLRYLVDELPAGADEAFSRAEEGVDVLLAPDVQLTEVLYQVSRGGVVAGIELDGSPNETLRRLVTNGPVQVAPIEEHELAVYASVTDLYTMHDGLLAAAHRVQGTDAIITKDEAFDGEDTLWE